MHVEDEEKSDDIIFVKCVADEPAEEPAKSTTPVTKKPATKPEQKPAAPATETPAAEQKKAAAPAVEPVPDTRNECQRGVAGYVVFEGKCITTSARDKIQSERAAARIAALRKQIDELDTQITSFSDKNKTVWRDADGNFNTARLATDSAAGVVLGTAGGLVTNKIIKKNQIKKGFEDIQCTVGGQVVANFGDEFTIGVQ